MYTLPIPLDLAIKNRIFVLRQHFLLRWHLHFPPFHLLHPLSNALECGVEGTDNFIDMT